MGETALGRTELEREEIDDLFKSEMPALLNYMAYKLWEGGHAPFKIRINAWFNCAESISHHIEQEMVIDLTTFEASCVEYSKRRAVEEAKDIIDGAQ